METMSAIKILRKFFGMKEGQTLKEFADEIRTLSDAEKEELVRLAAKELGVIVEES